MTVYTIAWAFHVRISSHCRRCRSGGICRVMVVVVEVEGGSKRNRDALPVSCLLICSHDFISQNFHTD
jgi:hypothetical protein